MNQDIEQLIKSELDYFEPMLSGRVQCTDEELALFRQETVIERRKRISNEMFNQLGRQIQHGPFQGMKLQNNPWWGGADLGAMCLGFYEQEILKLLFSSSLQDRELFIDIGAADGYYAIGMLHSKRVKETICFELSDKGRDIILSNWKANLSPGKLSINGDIFSDFKDATNDVDFSKAIMLIDIEGAEFDFLNEQTLKKISQSIVIIEIHNWVDQFIEKYQEFLVLAAKYFHIERIDPLDRSTVNLSELRGLTDDNRLLLISEGRPCVMRFLKLLPKSNHE